MHAPVVSRLAVHQLAPLPDVPALDDIAGASADDLTAFLASIDAFVAGPLAEIDVAGLSAEDAARLETLADQREAAQSRLDEITAAPDRAAAAAARLQPVPPAPVVDPAGTGAATDPPVPPAPPAEPAADPLAASGNGLPALPRRSPVLPSRIDLNRRPEPIRPVATITAGADLGNWSTGAEMSGGLREVAEAIIERRTNIHHVPEGMSDKMAVARIHANYDSSRRLEADATRNHAVVQSVTGPQALAAAGGLCAPLEPYYDIMVLAGAQRPVRGALPGFEADRGGITLIPPPKLSSVGPQARTVADGVTTSGSATITSATAQFLNYDVGASITGSGIPAGTVIIAVASGQTSATLSNNATATASGVSITITRPGATSYITAAVDALGLTGTPGQIASSLKPCLHISCAAPVSYTISAVTRCLEVGNFSGRTFPEQVEAWLNLVMSWQARLAETQLLNFLAANSTQVTQAQSMGVLRDLIPTVVKEAAYYRQNNRMDPDAPLRWMGPAWLLDAMVADMMRGSVYDSEFLRPGLRMWVETLLAEANVAASWYEDSGTGKGQYFNSGNTATAGAFTTFPGTAVHYLFAEGSFLFLDGGTLDLGVVRDSILNSQNNYRIFAESFEAMAFVGVEALEMTSSIAVTGQGSLPILASTGL